MAIGGAVSLLAVSHMQLLTIPSSFCIVNIRNKHSSKKLKFSFLAILITWFGWLCWFI